MNRLRLRAEGGFTLIELLVVIAIIGILAAIAIPQFAAYRRRGFVAQVTSDLRNAAVAEESQFAAGNAYTDCGGVACTNVLLPGFNPTAAVSVVPTLVGTTAFTLLGTSTNCDADETWTYSSTNGTVAPIAGAAGGCLEPVAAP